ncbi:hypothetical protein [Natrialba taiwanensis]|uniref:Uncharacterized protein n=1 Tax=Natrialba taiwanensis DSM 12281 TaxID=1230458 RepID=M0A9A9_9EURY|nr:hypothetical protein [Natrialba taiwanensis]ELY94467.1 hypothetical protein C484_05812 [Natrialba taiwanensis DSM 12281]
MGSRRAFVRRATAALGSLSLIGQAAGSDRTQSSAQDSPNANTAARTASRATGQTDRSSAGTTLTASANRTALQAARIPAHLRPLIAELERRLDGVSLTDLEHATGTATVAGATPLAGAAVVTGSLSRAALRAELTDREFTAVAERGDGQPSSQSTERFVDDEFAVALADDAVVLGYDARSATGTRTQSPALTHVDAALESRAGESSLSATASASTTASTPTATTLPRRTTAHKLAGTLSGDVVGAGTLDGRTRALLKYALNGASETDALFAVIDAAEAIGTAATVHSADRTTVTYGVVADPSQLSTDTVAAALETDREDATALRNVRVERERGSRLFRATATVDTETALQAHATTIGIQR